MNKWTNKQMGEWMGVKSPHATGHCMLPQKRKNDYFPFISVRIRVRVGVGVGVGVKKSKNRQKNHFF